MNGRSARLAGLTEVLAGSGRPLRVSTPTGVPAGQRHPGRVSMPTGMPGGQRHPSRGFTLIEVLVALAIFGMLSALAYGTLSQTLSNAEVLTERMQRLQALQRTMRYLTEDFMQLAPRPVREDLGDNFGPALHTDVESDFAVALTHGGWSNPAALRRGTLQRVAYRLEENELVRYHWTVLDRTLSNEPAGRALLDEVESVSFRFMQENGDWTEEWPPENRPGLLGLRQRPRAVEIVLTLTDTTEIRRLLEVAP